MEITADERLLLFIAIGYLAAVGVWFWSMRVRGDRMLDSVREHIDPGLWQELGAPRSVMDVVKDRDRRWVRFVNSGDYRRRCSSRVVDIIDEFKRRANVMAVVLGTGAALILYRFWPLLKPSFL